MSRKIADYRDAYDAASNDLVVKSTSFETARIDKLNAEQAKVQAEADFAAVIVKKGGTILDPSRGGTYVIVLTDPARVQFLPAPSIDDPADDPEPTEEEPTGEEPAPPPIAMLGFSHLVPEEHQVVGGFFLPKGVTWADVWRAVGDLSIGKTPKAPKGMDPTAFFALLQQIFSAMPLLAPFLEALAKIFGPKPPAPTPTPTPSAR